MPKDLTVNLADRPGTLADAAEALGEAGVNIVGGCGVSCGGDGLLHVLVEDAQVAKGALESAGLTATGERDVIVTRVADQPGALGSLARKLAEGGVNLDLFYVTADGQVVLGADDLDRARGLI